MLYDIDIYVLYDYYLDIELQDCNASVVHFLVIWITVLLLVLCAITPRPHRSQLSAKVSTNLIFCKCNGHM